MKGEGEGEVKEEEGEKKGAQDKVVVGREVVTRRETEAAEETEMSKTLRDVVAELVDATEGGGRRIRGSGREC